MGDRVNIVVKGSNEQIVLYIHWNGIGFLIVLQDALNRGEDRWDDFQYLTRIIFSEMIQDDILENTGYGITTTVWDGEDSIITVDVDNQTVTLYNETHSFIEYCELTFND